MRIFLPWYDEVPHFLYVMKGKLISIKRKSHEPEKIYVHDFFKGLVTKTFFDEKYENKIAYIGFIDSNQNTISWATLEKIEFESEEYFEFTYTDS